MKLRYPIEVELIIDPERPQSYERIKSRTKVIRLFGIPVYKKFEPNEHYIE